MINHSDFIGHYFVDDICKHYHFLKQINRVSFSAVYRVIKTSTGDIYCCKKIHKKQIPNQILFDSLIKTFKVVDHPNIVKLLEIFEDKVFVYLIMEECVGEPLYVRLSNFDSITEKKSALIFKQIVSSVNYLHSLGLGYIGINPDTILFSNLSEESPVKLIDIGIDCMFDTKKARTLDKDYFAPEMLKGEFEAKGDIWVLGVILYKILNGCLPFSEEDEEKTVSNILSGNFNKNSETWLRLSVEVKLLIQAIFVAKDERPNAQFLLDHDWLNYIRESHDSELSIDWKNIKEHFGELNIIQKFILNFSSFRILDEDLSLITSAFKSIDCNSDGTITIEELKEMISRTDLGSNFNSNDLLNIFETIDIDKNSRINYTEFLAAIYSYQKGVKNEHILDAFNTLDFDKNGKMSFEELKMLIQPNSNIDEKELLMLFQSFDKNEDGEIDLNEFLASLNLLVI